MYILFDIGGTNLRLASSNDGSSLNKVSVFPTPKLYNEAIELLKLEIPNLSLGEQIVSIAGGVPAMLNENNTQIVRSANLPDWSGKSFAADLEQIFSCSVNLENDATLAAIAEANQGAGKDYKSVVYITIGTGIGGALVVDGKLDSTATHSFEPGHHIIDPQGPLCSADSIAGHWEAYLKQNNFEETLGIGLKETLNHWKADIIVLGGGVTLNRNWDLEKIRTQIAELMPELETIPEIKIVNFGDKAGLHGALLLIK